MRHLIVFFLLLPTLPSWGAQLPALELSGEHPGPYQSLHPHAQLLEDADYALDFEAIRNPSAEVEARFQAIPDPVTNLNFTTSRFWVRFDLYNQSLHDGNFYLEVARPLTNTANLYLVRDAGAVEEHRNGDGIPFHDRTVMDRKMLYHIFLEPGEVVSGYLQLESDGEVITLPLRLWSKEAYLDASGREMLFHGFYYGILLFVSVIFTFFYFAMRERVFGYYVLYVLSLFALQFCLDGYAFRYLWPNSVWWASHSILFFASIAVAMAMTYARSFLPLKEQMRGFHKLFSGIIGLALVVLVFSLTGGITYEISFPMINGMSLASTLIILVTVVVALSRKVAVSYFFTTAFLLLMLSAFYFILGNINVIENTPLTENAIKFGSAIEVILLSISMAGRYRDIQREKEQAQQETLEKLEEMNRLKDQINVRLEQQVKERTAEINEQKEELAEKNKDITDSIRYAKRIQMAILPSQPTVETYLPDSFILYYPKDIVSGDFYWLRGMGAKTLFAAVDCTGHGVPGAFMSIVGQNGLNHAVEESGLTEPAAILDHLNQVVALTLRQKANDNQVKDGMDIALCCYEEHSGRVQYAGANNALWMIGNSAPTRPDGEALPINLQEDDQGPALYEVKANKQPIGSYIDTEPSPFVNHTLQLQKGDCFYVFSDGYPDQFGGPKGKKFMYKRLKRLLISIHHEPMDRQKEILAQQFADWKGDLEQIDDVCIIGVRV